jgi:hypothetical protein
MMMVAPIRLRTPTAGLEILLGVPPLVMHIQQLAVATANRLSRSPKEWSGSYGRKLGHIAWLASIALILPERERQDKCLVCCDTQKFTTCIDNEGKDLPYEAGLHYYTDGSGRHKTNGSSLAVFNGSHDPLHTDAVHVGKATVFQAEIHAITMECTFTGTQPDQQIVILSNCQSAIKAVSKPTISSLTVLQAVTALNTLAGLGKNVQLRWVQGHSD